MNVPHRLRYSNTWSLVGGTLWGGVGGVALLEEVQHWGRALRSFQLAKGFNLKVQLRSENLGSQELRVFSFCVGFYHSHLTWPDIYNQPYINPMCFVAKKGAQFPGISVFYKS